MNSTTSLEQESVGEVVRTQPSALHDEERAEGARGIGVVDVGTYEGVEEVHIGFFDLFEGVYGEQKLAAEGEAGDELWREERVGLEVVFVYDCVELFELV